jgi:hypothetical protein
MRNVDDLHGQLTHPSQPKEDRSALIGYLTGPVVSSVAVIRADASDDRRRAMELGDRCGLLEKDLAAARAEIGRLTMELERTRRVRQVK